MTINARQSDFVLLMCPSHGLISFNSWNHIPLSFLRKLLDGYSLLQELISATLMVLVHTILNANQKHFCGRYSQGCLVFAQDEIIVFCDALEAKVITFKCGLNHSVKNDLLPIVMETASKIWIRWFKDINTVLYGDWEITWNISAHIRYVEEILKEKGVVVTYIFRERNTLADFLANNVHDFAGTRIQFSSDEELPIKERTTLHCWEEVLQHLT